MKLSELRQIIKEELEAVRIKEGALPGKFKLISNWKEKIATTNQLSGTKQNLINKIEAIMQKKQAEGADDPTVITRREFGNEQEFQRYTTCKKKPNPTVSNSEPILEEEDKKRYCKTEEEAKNHPLAILYYFEKTASTREPRVSSGVRGRIPTDVNVKLDMVLGILNKFKAGEDLTDAEKRVVSRALSKTIA